MSQLPLALTPPRRRRFDNFVAGRNGSLVDSLRHALAEGGWIHLCGPPGTGKSHLAAAALAESTDRGRRACFVPAGDAGSVALLDSASVALAVVDDVDTLAGDAVAERALFNAMNCWRADAAAVLLTGSGAVDFELPDLVSRVGQAGRLVLKPLDDDGLALLTERLIADFGLVAGRGVSDYLRRRGPRGAAALARLFERVSRRVQSERRVMSIPLVREELREIEAAPPRSDADRSS
jgi:DnaA family protein